MYLALLKEIEKEAFLGMAYHLTVADGTYSESEKNMMNGYCQELQYSFDEETKVKPIDTLIQFISLNSDEKVKKIFIFELIGLALSDGNYDVSEKAIINKMADSFNIKSDFVVNCEQMINQYIDFQYKMNQLILE